MRIGVMLAASGALIVAGLALLAVASGVVLEGVSQESGHVGGGAELSASADFARGESAGVFAVQVAEFEAGAFYAELAGPSGTVADVELESATLEEGFEAEPGTYTLTVRGAERQTQAIAAVGQPPDGGGESLGRASVYVLAAGMCMLAGTGAYGVWRRRSV